MNERIKKLWIEALTSGEYKQGAGCLRDNKNRYCCLGVLTDLYRKETNTRWRRVRGYYEFQDASEYLTGAVVEWAELDRANPRVRDNDFAKSFSSYNDGGTSFPEIADLIEKCL